MSMAQTDCVFAMDVSSCLSGRCPEAGRMREGQRLSCSRNVADMFEVEFTLSKTQTRRQRNAENRTRTIECNREGSPAPRSVTGSPTLTSNCFKEFPNL